MVLKISYNHPDFKERIEEVEEEVNSYTFCILATDGDYSLIRFSLAKRDGSTVILQHLTKNLVITTA